MPELPDVEIFRQYAQKHAMNKKITRVAYHGAGQVLESTKQKISRQVKNANFTESARVGKHMFLKISSGSWLALHFGMTGNLKYFESHNDPPKYSKADFYFDDDRALAFISKRKLGELEITKDPDTYCKDHNIGIDVYDGSFEEFKEALKDKRGGIKNVLMDQSRVSGIGNEYSDEILYQEKLHPKAKFEKLNEKALKSLYNTIQRVMKTAINNKADPSKFPDRYLLQHRKEGEECPDCKGKIKKIKINGRGCYICPECQKL